MTTRTVSRTSKYPQCETIDQAHSSSIEGEDDTSNDFIQRAIKSSEKANAPSGNGMSSKTGSLLCSIQQAFTKIYTQVLRFNSISRHFESPTPDSGTGIDHGKDLGDIPNYVLDYAPLVHLFDKEQYWPCDIADHLKHTTPYLNYTPIEAESDHPTLTNLDALNEYGPYVYLHSNDDVRTKPDWLTGVKNIPVDPGQDDGGNTKPKGGRSSAPAILVVVNKPHGIVDAFWFFFYSYNLGNTVFNVRFGNHVGDWEHMLVRFKHGKPRELFFSEHSWGKAYTYKAVEKIGKRPVGFSATGTHAMYAKEGVHRYVLPFGLLHDETSRGPLWDPLLNSYAYTYDTDKDEIRASNATPKAPTEWFHYQGRWGDKIYPVGDSRQYKWYGNYHYVSGPTGPKFKGLRRQTVCQGRGECKVNNWIGEEDSLQWIGEDEWKEHSDDTDVPDEIGLASSLVEEEL